MTMTGLFAQIPYQALVLLGSALVTVFKSIAFVQEGQRGVKLRFGKAVRYRTGKNAGQPKIVLPGFVFMIPYIDKLKRRHVRQETIRLDYQKIMFKDGMIFQVSAMLLFTVTDVFKAMFEIEDLGDAVETLGLAILREELSSHRQSDARARRGSSQRDRHSLCLGSEPGTHRATVVGGKRLVVIFRLRRGTGSGVVQFFLSQADSSRHDCVTGQFAD
jgi:hypothetical protein